MFYLLPAFSRSYSLIPLLIFLTAYFYPKRKTNPYLYGVLLVSNRNPDGLTERFGIWVGDVLGDGFDAVDKFVDAIQKILNDEVRRYDLSREAQLYVKRFHDRNLIIPNLRNEILNLCDGK